MKMPKYTLTPYQTQPRENTMPARVSLRVVEGPTRGCEHRFEERSTCIIGRARDCNLRLPNDAAHRVVSRHHCLLDINPPEIRIRDFGSLNGTFVNGEKIGQRHSDESPDEGALRNYPEHDLVQGDLIGLGQTVFRVDVRVPAICAGCFEEIPESRDAQPMRNGFHFCDACLAKSVEARNPPLPRRPRCALCGKEILEDPHHGRPGQVVCTACRMDPLEQIKGLLLAAAEGNKNLVAVEGFGILKELGRGGMGRVYLARHEATNREVALKIMLPQVAADERAREMFERECANHRALRHPHVVQVFDHGCSNGVFYLTMEYCPGGSLDRRLGAAGGKLSLDSVLEFALPALDGLDYIHNAEIPFVKLKDGTYGPGRGLVHRDLKPGNLFLSSTDPGARIQIADVGLAKAFDLAGLSGLTVTGQAAGTPEYMPRQQVLQFKYSRPEVDVWAMAATLYHLLTGCLPRDFSPGKDRWLTVLQTRPVPIRRRDPALPRRFAAAIDHALTDDPEIGFKTAAEFKRALEESLS